MMVKKKKKYIYNDGNTIAGHMAPKEWKKKIIKRQTDKKQTPQLLMLGLVAFCHFYLR